MSGYQKGKADEAKILESLREEGLLAMPKGKTAGGLSFEVVDANVVFDSKPENDGEGDVFVSSQFIPSKTLARLELRRGVIFIVVLIQTLHFDLLIKNQLGKNCSIAYFDDCNTVATLL